MTLVVISTTEQSATIHDQRAVARRLLSYGLSKQFGIDAGKVSIDRNCFGKPFLVGQAGVHFSVAHCDRGVVAMFSNRPVGIDVEMVRPHDPRVAARVLTDSELAALGHSPEPDREFFRYWTIKESYVKALGTGLSYPLRKLNITITPEGGVRSNRRAAFWINEDLAHLVIAMCRLGDTNAEMACSIEQTEWNG